MLRFPKIFACCACFAFAGSSFGQATHSRTKSAARPNIVVILADDLGFSDLGCYGGEIETPNLDRLAAGGLRFTQFYNAGRCCPTRASLLTGLYAHRAGMGLMEDDFGLPGYRGFLNRNCVTIAEALREGGYQTFVAGKWNVGYQAGQWPLDRGFERYFGLLRGACDYFDPRVGRRAKISLFGLDRKPFDRFDEDFYTTDAFTDFAIDRVTEAVEVSPEQRRPFFLYLAYTAPHSPLQARPEDIAKYRGRYAVGWDEIRETRRRRQIEQGLFPAGLTPAPRDSRVRPWTELSDAERDFEDLKMAVFAAQVDRLDRGIGRLLAKLAELGIERNTLVMFLSDNGGDGEPETATSLPPGPKGSSHIYGRPWAGVSNSPFRGYKHAMQEGGIATPFLVYWPAIIAEPHTTSVVGHVVDLLPTCLDVAGVAYPNTFSGAAIEPVAGRSLFPVFRRIERPEVDLFWEHEGNRAVRSGRWKLLADHSQPWELYDLETDRTELRDLAAAMPDRVVAMSAKYSDWARRNGVMSWDELRATRRK